MDWTPGGVSSDIEDRRDSSGGGGGGFGFGGGGGGGIGIIGFVILVVISLITGHNFLGGMLSGGGGQGSSSYQQQPQQSTGDDAYGSSTGAVQPHPAGEDRDVQLISFVLDDVQKEWTQIFAAQGKTYTHAKLVIYRGATYSGCGTAQAQTGPFYCPQDKKVYIDLSFWDELKKFGGSTADFAQAYVIAHELGHHVQDLLGIMAAEDRLVSRDSSERNPLSVDLELQADCFAGVWGHTGIQRGIIHPEDVTAGLSAAAAVGDDHLQSMSGRAVSPESWTHGSSAAREKWLQAGLNGGTIQSCTTFNGQVSPAAGGSNGDY